MTTASTRLRLGLLSMACASLLGACKEPTATPAPTSAATPAAPAATASVTPDDAAPSARPVELSADERRVVLQPSALCNLERIGDTLLGSSQAYVVGDATALVAHGWVGDEATSAPPAEAFLMVRQIGGPRVWQLPIHPSVKRADVAKYKNSPALETSGFAAPLDLSELPAGTYRMLIVHDRDGARYACDNGRNLQIGG